ncbi:MAG: LysM peptidoglycan-binding domain-containing protein, partial [Bacteroidota bacterium]
MNPQQDSAKQATRKPPNLQKSPEKLPKDAHPDNPFLAAEAAIQAREQLNPFALAAQKFGLDAYLQMKPEVKDPIVVHTVLKGENVYQIARFYGSTVAELVALNDLKERTVNGQNHIHIQTGDQLKAYDRRKGKRVSESTQEERIDFHKVEAQETAYGIANKYSMTVDELAGLNQLQVQSKNGAAYVKIKAGEFLRVYSDGNVLNLGLREIDHPVVEGDSLYGLSITYGVEEDEIKAHNDLESDTIK